jgi:CXXC-20-CXXC protein
MGMKKKARTCPYCGYQYNATYFLRKFFFRTNSYKWYCPNCKKELGFDRETTFSFAVISGLIGFLTAFLMDMLNHPFLKYGVVPVLMFCLLVWLTTQRKLRVTEE